MKQDIACPECSGLLWRVFDVTEEPNVVNGNKRPRTITIDFLCSSCGHSMTFERLLGT